MTQEEREASDRVLFSRLWAHEWMQKANTVFAFYGIGHEPATSSFLAACLEKGIRLCLPRVEGRQMAAYQVNNLETLAEGTLSIPEPTSGEPVNPAEIGLILVPNLCCDRQGYRLGQGGGYYDRYLADYKGKTISLCRELVLQETLPVSPWDIPIQCVLTETEELYY